MAFRIIPKENLWEWIIPEGNIWRCVIDLGRGDPQDVLLEAESKDVAIVAAFSDYVSDKRTHQWLWEEVIKDKDKHLDGLPLIKALRTYDDVLIDACKPVLEDYWTFIARF